MRQPTIIHGDAQHLPLADCSVHAIVCDPPYELGFMSKKWDSTGVAYDVATWREAYRVMKPGAFLVAFGGTRTFHRLTCAIEDAGFEIRDSIGHGHTEPVPVMAWLSGSGFPKSLNVSRAIDLAAGVDPDEPSPVTDDARRWQGFGTALKPAWEPIVCARKPIQGTVAANVLQWGCGALNVDGCRTPAESGANFARPASSTGKHDGWQRPWMQTAEGVAREQATKAAAAEAAARLGRWPTNVVFSHVGLTDGDGDIIGDACDPVCVDGCPVAELDAQSGNRPGFSSQRDLSRQAGSDGTIYGRGINCVEPGKREGYNDSGGASRFFPTFRYQAKAPARERPKVNGVAHPCVKPLGLMRWLVRLVGGQPGGTILDMFAGSGATIEAALLEGFNAIGVERSAEYLPLIQQRIDRATTATQPAVDDMAEPTLFDVA